MADVLIQAPVLHMAFGAFGAKAGDFTIWHCSLSWDPNSEEDMDHYEVSWQGHRLVVPHPGTSAVVEVALAPGQAFRDVVVEARAVDTSGNKSWPARAPWTVHSYWPPGHLGSGFHPAGWWPFYRERPWWPAWFWPACWWPPEWFLI